MKIEDLMETGMRLVLDCPASTQKAGVVLACTALKSHSIGGSGSRASCIPQLRLRVMSLRHAARRVPELRKLPAFQCLDSGMKISKEDNSQSSQHVSHNRSSRSRDSSSSGPHEA